MQGTVVFNTHVPTLGRYAFLLHSYQPAHPTFPVEVLINGGRVWQGEWLQRAVGDSSRVRSLAGVSHSHSLMVWASHHGDRWYAGSMARVAHGTAPITWL